MSSIKYNGKFEYKNGKVEYVQTEEEIKKEEKAVLIAFVIATTFKILWFLGFLAMLVCGALGVSTVNIIPINNDGGAITMIVLGALFGGLPIVKAML